VWVCAYVDFVMCGCFDTCVDVLVICVLGFTVFCIVCTVFFEMFRLCLFILICFVCTGARTTATE
jgi:membrane protein required for beta-lactamase induction